MTYEKNLLITLPLKFSQNLKKTNLIFLSQNDYNYQLIQKKNKKIKTKLISSPWLNISKRQKDYLYLQRQYEKFSSILTITLNSLNNTKRTKKYWEQKRRENLFCFIIVCSLSGLNLIILWSYNNFINNGILIWTRI